jgi:ribosomal protein L37AE/L43A
MQKYRQTSKGREANRRTATSYYRKNKKKINAKHRERLVCPFCEGNYNTQYFTQRHLICCNALS